ncbi:origin recognition complex subunit 1 [Periplaneta americana]|uniref:origin recognition complex subunit 1 n=1 Tax=Periplaneta americana TaxID=6978 RepID=UPI0037E9225A
MKRDTSLPVFVCRYKLEVADQSKKIEPYLSDREKRIISSASPSKRAVTNKSKTNEAASSNIESCAKLGSEKEKGSTKKITETAVNGNNGTCNSYVTADMKNNIRRNLKRCFVKIFPIESENKLKERVKTKASEAVSVKPGFVFVNKFSEEKNEKEESADGREGSCSPAMPHTEPVLKWCGVRDGQGHLKVMEVPITTPELNRKPLQSIGSEKNIRVLEIIDMTSESEDEAENNLTEKEKKKRDVKLNTLDKSKGKSVLGSKDVVHKAKLKDGDISRLLDDEESNDGMFILDDDAEGESKVKNRFNLKPGYSTPVKLTPSKSHSNSKSKSSAKKTPKTTTDSGSKQIAKVVGSVDRTTKSSNVHKIEIKTKLYEKENAEITLSPRSSKNKLIINKRNTDEVLSSPKQKVNTGNDSQKTSSIVKTSRQTLPSALHQDDKEIIEHLDSDAMLLHGNTIETINNYKNVHISAKKLSLGEKEMDTETEVVVKNEKTDVRSPRNKKPTLSAADLCVAGSSSIVEVKAIHKAEVINRYLESMDCSSPSRVRNNRQRNKEHWISVLEENEDGDASSCSSSVRLKLCRTKPRVEKSIKQETPSTTRRRRKRVICDSDTDSSESPHRSKSKRHKRAVSSDSDDDYVPSIQSKSKLHKRETVCTNDNSEDESLNDLKSKLQRTNEPHTPRTPKTDSRNSPCVRTSSRKRKPNKRYDNDWTTPLSTPVPSQKKQDTHATPVTPKTPKAKANVQASTTASKKNSARRLLLTPSMPTRTSCVSTPGSVLEEARARLHVSAVPKSLPCREKEFENIYRFVEDKLLDRTGGCMYISGVPGTGKTATVKELVRSLQQAVSRGELPGFEFVELNGMRLTEPRQAYVQLLKSLTNQTMTSEQAQQVLERRFSAHTRKATLLLVDELDLLWTRRQDVVYNLLDWPTRSASRLIVLTIANTMDLPERLLMGRVTSRLGLTRVTFHPYSHKQLQEIVMSRLKGLEVFDPDAVQLVARKVAAVSGDARRALDICRRAAELVEIDKKDGNEIVTMQHVDQALYEMIASPKVQAIKFCSKMEQLFLQAVAAEVQRTGVEETVFEKVFIQLRTLCVFDGCGTPSVTEALGMCARLGSCRLLLTEHSRADIHQRVLLNVSSDDIHYALRVK